MCSSDDILSGFTTDDDTQLLSTEQALTLQEKSLQEALRKAHKKLRQAKKKGRCGKKSKKKLKQLKKQHDKLKELLRTSKQYPLKGRWDGLFEKSVPEAFKLVNTIVDRILLPPKGR